MIKIEIISSENNLPKLPNAIKTGLKATLIEIGTELESAMRNRILSNIPPPLAETTVQRKGHNLALVDTGAMFSQITSVVVSDTEVKAGVFGDKADVAAAHEYGTRTIPERSFIRSSQEELKNNIGAVVKDKLNAELIKVLIK